MKRKTTDPRSRKVTIRLSTEEYQEVQEKFKRTTHRQLSGYLRDLVRQRPVTVYTRNQSLDEFLAIAIGLKNELNTIGKNVNQAVKKLEILRDATHLNDALQFYDAAQFSLLQKTEEIRSTLIKIHQLWSQK
jgi:hypothetical protein